MLQFVCAAWGWMLLYSMCRGEVLVKDLYLYRRWRLYGVDTDMSADRQGHKCTQLFPNTHERKKCPVPRNGKICRTCINWKAQNQSCHPQQHLLLKGNTKSLCIYDIPSSAFLLQNFLFIFFASIEGFSFCLLTGALSAREKNKLKPSSETYKRTSICCMVIYMGGI